jgi:hypothetical protein
MKLVKVTTIAAVVASAQAVAMAQGTQGATDRVICRRIAQTGTHRPGPRICRTHSEWKAMESERDRDSDGQQFLKDNTIANDPHKAASPTFGAPK